MEIIKSHPIPLYYQLAQHLREQIQSGELRPGDRLPSERDLSEQAGISRMTARQAIGFLVREGVLIARHGVGTFVAEPKLVYDAMHLLGFTEEMLRQGFTVTSRVLEQTLVTPPAYIAAALGLPPQASTVKLVRLRLRSRLPVLVETSFLPATLCPGLADRALDDKSLFAVLEEEYGLRIQRSRQSIEAVVANEYEAGLFAIEPRTAMFLMEGVNYLEQDQPVEYFKCIYRGDCFRFELESRRDRLAAAGAVAQRVSVIMDQ